MELAIFMVLLIGWMFAMLWTVRKARANGLPEWQLWVGVLLLGPFCPLMVFLRAK